MPNDDQVMDLIRDQFEQVNKRLDQHYDLFQKHTEDDKRMADHIIEVEKEITFAKGIAYVLGGITSGIVVLLEIIKK